MASVDQPANQSYHTQQDLKLQFYRTTGLNPPSNESKNRLMLGSRLREIFQASNDINSEMLKGSLSGGHGTDTPSQIFNVDQPSFKINSKPLRSDNLSPNAKHKETQRSSQRGPNFELQNQSQPNINAGGAVYQKYLELNTTKREENMSGSNFRASSGDFKLKVQQKIFDIQNEIKNPSPIKSPAATYGNLDSYIKKQNEPCIVVKTHHGKEINSGSADSMQVNFDN